MTLWYGIGTNVESGTSSTLLHYLQGVFTLLRCLGESRLWVLELLSVCSEGT